MTDHTDAQSATPPAPEKGPVIPPVLATVVPVPPKERPYRRTLGTGAAEEQPPTAADATACTPNCDGSDMCTGQGQRHCAKCRRAFDPTDTRFDGRSRQSGTPFCRTCTSLCHETEIADHWCPIDAWRVGDPYP